jgi:hypothetical protein
LGEWITYDRTCAQKWKPKNFPRFSREMAEAESALCNGPNRAYRPVAAVGGKVGWGGSSNFTEAVGGNMKELVNAENAQPNRSIECCSFHSRHASRIRLAANVLLFKCR